MEVPDWKVHLLERRRKEEEEVKRKGKEEEERLSKMPSWKREIILRRKAKLGASLSGSREELDSGEQEEKEKIDGGGQEEKESTVLTEKIGPVQQNPFIQLEKQRRAPEGCFTRPKPSLEPHVLRTTRVEDVVKDPNPPSEEEMTEVTQEEPLSVTEEGRGRVSRLLSRFGRPWIEGDNSGQRVNGEEDVVTPTVQPALIAEEPVQPSPPSPPPPSCPQIATGSYNSTQETTLSSHSPVSSSTSCSDSEPAVLSTSVASVAMSASNNTRPSSTDEARPFPFNLRPASPAIHRPPKLTAQASSVLARPEVFNHGTTRVEEEGEGRPGLNRVTCLPQVTQNRGNLDSQAMQRRKGNTITVNPRKMAVCENGFVATETKAAAPKSETGKKRYPTADEIKVIGGYQALGKSCLAKHTRDKKKLNISFPESELECTFEYPSESSFLSEFGPPEESEAPAPPAQPEDDEEEESVLLGGIMRRKALIVDESCKR
ncbi:phostensin [Discoglossus pictus]